MLHDLERKLLRILYNFSSQHRRMPRMPELQQKTGRSREDITGALRVLVEQQYILWPDNPKLETITILEGWERGTEEAKKAKPNGNNMDYYMYY